ncbi:glycosyltransferase [Mesobacillus maritimus]|uniref:glycosyltransferase family 2 protein n=1 Tax=Mesobacillus maritimus TaxID=1643336 RepID=UPI00203A4896|nr:glycosyltransferase family 2 protein [Mesobacillus maritimus]MCM3585189.1 glycosyltransferase [Mesobacillus maritimus]
MPPLFRENARALLTNKELSIQNNPKSIINKVFNKTKKVAVVTAAYNCAEYLPKTIDSVINQTIGFENIQYIIVDDGSTDSTKQIIEEYATKFKNICYVALHKNTGSPGTPRNIGIELANADYITFLDADDWLAPKGIETLVRILDETNDDYVVGKTIKVTEKGESIIGEFASVKERRKISPFYIPHFFYHMGPTARMMKLALLKDKEIGFPEMVFAEDKLFFCDVFLAAQTVSTTTEPIYYVNRLEENRDSLTRSTHVLEKRKSDLKVIDYIKEKKLPIEKEKVILNRLYEYDFVKTFDSQLFVKSGQKEDFLSLLHQVIETTNDLRYDFKEQFKNPLYRVSIELFLENRIEDFTNLFVWFKNDKNKKYVIKNSLPYYEVPFLKDKYKYIPMNLFARALDSYIIGNTFYQHVEIFGDDLDRVNHVLIRDRTKHDNDLIVNFERNGNLITYKIHLEELTKLSPSLFTVFLRFDEYQLLNIKKILKNQVSYDNRAVEFYTSIANNLGISIKPIKKE